MDLPFKAYHMTQSHELKPAAQSKPDGRLLRSERSRQLIIEAIIELIDEGFLIPTAQQVAQRADVGIRSVFRHFDDMEDMFKTANEIIFQDTRPLFVGGDRSGTLETRVSNATEQITAGYSSVKNFMLSGRIRRWNTPVILKNYTLNRKRLQKELEDWIPEILELTEANKQCAYALASFDFWFRLHEDQEVSQADCVDIISRQLRALLPQ
ncbi:MAG: AcrR family transcriptional regulator [Porticoccaceae bacterium]|jgi:AcrR family transcriptional regulator|tara:strand:- start:1396 stop:2025 length:630 start_codon:yes stop_codon:yes gene_type:complete